MPGPGISGTAVAMAAAGGYLVYSGIHDVPLLDGLRQLAHGQVPQGRDAQQGNALGRETGNAIKGIGQLIGKGTPDGGSPPIGAPISQPPTGNAGIADDARRYLGVPYKINGHTPAGFDCSGLVTWVLHHDIGLNLPNNTHTVTGQFLVWSGAYSIPANQCAAGDLVCWVGHIGIATGPKTMIAAPQPGERVKEQNIWWVPAPVIRRVRLH